MGRNIDIYLCAYFFFLKEKENKKWGRVTRHAAIPRGKFYLETSKTLNPRSKAFGKEKKAALYYLKIF